MSAGLKLQGQFKFDLYDISGNLLETSNYINNFITQSGLIYPLHFAFADCFRFLSVGSGDIANSIIPASETTGLEIPVPELSYIGGRNDFYNKDSTNYALFPSCGYRFPSGNVVELYRGWTLPNNSGGEEGAFKTNGTFKEFMVTPGRPYVKAINPDPPYNTGMLCSCYDEAFGFYGKDCSTVAEYYNLINSRPNSNRLKICDATKAFARVLHTQDYVSGSILNVTYKLTISINTGLRLQEMYDTSSTTSNFYGKWNLVQGVTQPGIKLINDGLIVNKIPRTPNSSIRLQHYNYTLSSRSYDFSNEYGESFIPAHGIPLEPSVHYFSEANENTSNSIHNIIHYFSQDNTQFLFSASGGAFNNTGEFAPWNFYFSDKVYRSGDLAYFENYTYKYINQNPDSGKALNDNNYWQNLGYLKVVDSINSGIKQYRNETEKAFDQLYWNQNPSEYNIRFNGAIIPNTGNILLNTNFGKNHFKSSQKGNISIGLINNRTGYFRNNFIFNGYGFPQNFYIKSFISAYRDSPLGVSQSSQGDSGNYIPFLDSIFSGSGNNIFIPEIVTGIKDYSPYGNTGAFISGSNSEDYFYLSPGLQYPILFNSLEWSANCPQGVLGCS